MKFLGVDHIDIIVSDLDASIEFYRKFGTHPEGTVEDPPDAQKEIEFIGGVDFLFEPFENQQSGRTISNCYDPDGVQIQMSRQTSPGTYKNWG